ncbi:PAS domain S-box protein [Leptolyngbya sp. FACHB-671]|uniref:PAS domain S-box protein n=1 Tax=Leptolyngbya sp. FACHB-671 TaxID=2692812 RepID=UPI00168620A3|nr:PAS domain S-box protein [Leptolyngbya sp. FACHB-671]MBD2067541.1 PAS domain S-box protein [Leptolyngbya sp. FACHB-671]
MVNAPLPANESDRLQALHQYRILDTAAERGFDDITQLAAQICQTPIALVGLLEGDRQWFKSKVGLETPQVPRNIAFCSYTIGQSMLIVPDTLADPRFTDNPLVTNDPHIRFYAGVTLLTSEGYALGTLCVLDRVPRELTAEQVEALKVLGQQAVRQLELRRNLTDLERMAIERRKTKRHGSFRQRLALGFGVVAALAIGMSAIAHRGEFLLITSLNIGALTLFFSLIRQEMAKHRQIEVKLEQERDFSAAVLDTVGALVVVLNPQGEIIRFNNRCVQTTGFAFEEVRHKPFWNVFLTAEEIEPVKAEFFSLKVGQFPNTYENYWLTKWGEQRLIAWSNTALLNPKGAVEYIIGTGIDITERRQAELALQKSETTTHALLEVIPDLLIRMNRNGTYLDFVSAKDGAKFAPFNKMQGRNVYECIPLELAHQRMQYVNRALQTGEMQIYEFQFQMVGVLHTQEARIVVSGEDEVLVIVRDISDRKQAEVALAQLAAIVESSDDAILSTSLDSRITSWNLGAEKIYGYSAEEALGQTVTSLLLPPNEDERSPIPESLQPQTHLDYYKTRHRRKDGRLIDVFLTLSPVKDQTGKITGASMIGRDVSDRTAIERMKDEFISTVSHELRTPLTSLRGSLGLLLTGKMGTLTEKGHRMLEIAVNNSDRLIRLINDILDLERLESDKFTLHQQSCNAADLLRQVAEMMQPMSERAGVTLCCSSISVSINVDPDRLIQVFTNLISNAIKFSAAGSTVWLIAETYVPPGAKDSSAKPPMLLISVRDQGRGIPPEKLESIFERFQQVDASDSRQKGGTGLGLAICRNIVRQHGGKIWVDSGLGEGSCFYLTLPLAESNGLKGLLVGNKQSIVMCHDASTHFETLQGLLEQQNYQVVVVKSVKEAIARAAALQPKAILLDLDNPKTDDWELLTLLKQRNSIPDIPLIIFDNPSSRVEFELLGTMGWVYQSADYASLFQMLKQFAMQQGQVGRVLIVEDDLDLTRVLAAMLGCHQVQTAYAQTQQAAIELCQHFIPDLLVLDLTLSKGSGFAVVEWLRQQEHFCQMPLIIYTAQELGDVERSRLHLSHLGQTEFITKSRAVPEALEALIMRLLNRATAGGERFNLVSGGIAGGN